MVYYENEPSSVFKLARQNLKKNKKTIILVRGFKADVEWHAQGLDGVQLTGLSSKVSARSHKEPHWRLPPYQNEPNCQRQQRSFLIAADARLISLPLGLGETLLRSVCPLTLFFLLAYAYIPKCICVWITHSLGNVCVWVRIVGISTVLVRVLGVTNGTDCFQMYRNSDISLPLQR